jgi:hypothetical protein
MTTTTSTTTTKRTATKTVEISVWGLRGRLAAAGVEISDSAVRVANDGEDTAQSAFGRRVARVLGRGAYLCNARYDSCDGNDAIYELTFGRDVKLNGKHDGTNVVGSCWIKVYR